MVPNPVAGIVFARRNVVVAQISRLLGHIETDKQTVRVIVVDVKLYLAAIGFLIHHVVGVFIIILEISLDKEEVRGKVEFVVDVVGITNVVSIHIAVADKVPAFDRSD